METTTAGGTLVAATDNIDCREGMTEARDVAGHYGRGQILDVILRALESIGKDLGRLVPADLGPVDEFHTRGREATVASTRDPGRSAAHVPSSM